MKANRNRGYKLILYITILVSLFISCNKVSKSNDTYQHVFASSDSAETIMDSPSWLKYTSGIHVIFEDSKGNMWFGSHNEGVCLFDGSKFTYFIEEDGLNHNQVSSFQEDQNGKIWIKTSNGLNSFDGKQLSSQTEKDYDSKQDWGKSENDLWFWGDKGYGYTEREGQPGVYRYHDGKFTFLTFPIPLIDHANSLYTSTTTTIKAKDGTLWFGTFEAVIGYDGESFTIINREKMGRKDDPLNIGIRALCLDSKGNLWLGDNGSGVFVYDGEKVINFSELHKVRKKDTKGNSMDRISSITEDNDGNIWFGTAYESGAWRYNYDTDKLANFTKKDGLISNNIKTIYKTSKGVMLFGADEPSCVYTFNGNSFDRVY